MSFTGEQGKVQGAGLCVVMYYILPKYTCRMQIGGAPASCPGIVMSIPRLILPET